MFVLIWKHRNCEIVRYYDNTSSSADAALALWAELLEDEAIEFLSLEYYRL